MGRILLRATSVRRGSVNLSEGDETKVLTFSPALPAAPVHVGVEIIAPADGYVISHSIDADPTASGCTVRFGAAIPGAGYKLSWIATV